MKYPDRQITCVLILLFMIISPLPVLSFLIDSQKNYKELSSRHFTIIYPDDKEKASRILQLAENVHLLLREQFRMNYYLHTQIILIDQSDLANGLATVLPDNIIILYDVPPEPLSEASLLNYYKNMEELLIHEYSHILHDNQTEFSAPLKPIGFPYLNLNLLLPPSCLEGVAVANESWFTSMGRAKSSYSHMILRTAVYEDCVPAIDEISAYINRIPNGDGPYIWSGMFHYYLYCTNSPRTVLNAYYQNANDCCMAFKARPLACACSCLTLFPLNSAFEKYTGADYYSAYNKWTEIIKEKYSLEIKKITDPTRPHFLNKEDAFWDIYDILPVQNKVYFSAYSPHTGYGLYCYSQETQKTETILDDTYITALAYNNNRIYFTGFEKNRNINTYSSLYYYDLAVEKVYPLQPGKRITSAAVSSGYQKNEKDIRNLVYVQTEKKSKKIMLYSPQDKRQRILWQSSREDIISDLCFINTNEFYFLYKKESDHLDIYHYNISSRQLQRLTDNPALELSLSTDRSNLYFLSDFNGKFDMYQYNYTKKQFYQVSDLITGALRTKQYDHDLYYGYLRSDGFYLSMLTASQRKKIPVTYKKESYPNFLMPDRKIPEENFPLGAEENFSVFNSLFSHFMIIPQAQINSDNSLYSLVIYFSDIFLRNNLMLQSGYSFAEETWNFTAAYQYTGNKNNWYFEVYSLYQDSGIDLEKHESGNITYTYLKNYLFRNLNLFSTLNYHKRIYQDSGRSLYYNSLQTGFVFNNSIKYPYSIIQEKGWFLRGEYCLMKRFLHSSYDTDLLNINIKKFQRTFFLHHILGLEFYSGNTLNPRSEPVYEINDFQYPSHPPLYTITMNGYHYLHQERKHFFLGAASYNFPVIWIERGIKHLPLLLRSIWGALIYQAGNGYNDIDKLLFLRTVSSELHFNFQYFHVLNSDLVLGAVYELDEKQKLNYYLKTVIPF